MRIYDDDRDGRRSDNDVIKTKELTTSVLLEMPIAFVAMECCILDTGTFQRSTKKGLSLKASSSNTGVDLLFEVLNEHDDYLLWEKAILEAQEATRRNLNRLKQAKNTISLLTSVKSFKSYELVLSKVPSEAGTI